VLLLVFTGFSTKNEYYDRTAMETAEFSDITFVGCGFRGMWFLVAAVSVLWFQGLCMEIVDDEETNKKDEPDDHNPKHEKNFRIGGILLTYLFLGMCFATLGVYSVQPVVDEPYFRESFTAWTQNCCPGTGAWECLEPQHENDLGSIALLTAEIKSQSATPCDTSEVDDACWATWEEKVSTCFAEDKFPNVVVTQEDNEASQNYFQNRPEFGGAMLGFPLVMVTLAMVVTDIALACKRRSAAKVADDVEMS